MQQIKLTQADLWKYTDCEFSSDVAGHKVRVILKSTDCKHAIVSNYYHRSNTYKISMKSFLKTFTLVEDTIRNV